MTIISRSIMLSIFFGNAFYAEPGCIDTSYHLAQLNDPKDYHTAIGADGRYCPCPCSKYCAQYHCSLNKGRCPVCGHYRIPKPYVITSASKQSHELPTATSRDGYKMPFILKKIRKQDTKKPS